MKKLSDGTVSALKRQYEEHLEAKQAAQHKVCRAGDALREANDNLASAGSRVAAYESFLKHLGEL